MHFGVRRGELHALQGSAGGELHALRGSGDIQNRAEIGVLGERITRLETLLEARSGR